MANAQNWKNVGFRDGVWTVEVESWLGFNDLIHAKFIDKPHFVWRGQRDAAWPLDSTLDRLIKRLGVKDAVHLRETHLSAFQMAARGRRGLDPPELSSNDWWSLGQHYGLATPLLDWTRSPFVGAFFALQNGITSPSGSRAVWGLTGNIQIMSKKIQAAHDNPDEAPIVQFIDPRTNDNPRLVSQGGLFTRSPDGIDIEAWVATNYRGDKMIRLVKIVIPESERKSGLIALNRMNINHLSLFPDLYGACTFANLALEVKQY
jgi:hypothetical protein